MKIKQLILLAFLCILFIGSSFAQDITIHKHPRLNFSFESTGNWEQNPYHKDDMIYEMVNTDNDINVMLWYNGGTEMDCEKYLVKMADMKEFNFNEPVRKDFDDKTIWILECTGIQNESPVTNILAAMSYIKPYEKDAPERCQGKSYNAMHIARIWCPESKYQDNKMQMDDIIASLELTR
jgi:hypothetical protein